MSAKQAPAYYLNKLRTYLDPKASRSHRVSRFNAVSALCYLDVGAVLLWLDSCL